MRFESLVFYELRQTYEMCSPFHSQTNGVYASHTLHASQSTGRRRHSWLVNIRVVVLWFVAVPGEAPSTISHLTHVVTTLLSHSQPAGRNAAIPLCSTSFSLAMACRAAYSHHANNRCKHAKKTNWVCMWILYLCLDGRLGGSQEAKVSGHRVRSAPKEGETGGEGRG